MLPGSGSRSCPTTKFNRQIQVINDIFRTEAAKHAGVEYVDAWALFTQPEWRLTRSTCPTRAATCSRCASKTASTLPTRAACGWRRAVMALVKRDWLEQEGRWGHAAAEAVRQALTLKPDGQALTAARRRAAPADPR